MALCVCKCLNISLECDKIEDNADIGKLELTTVEQRDIFFSEKIFLSRGTIKSIIAQPALTGRRSVGRWTLHSCLICGLTTHATLEDSPNLTLINKNTLTTINEVNNLKRSTSFSPVFNLLVPEVTSDVEMKENIDTNNFNNEKRGFAPTQQAIGNLNKQLSQTLQSELENVEEIIQQFRDQKYAEFEAYREKAHRDHKILASIISKARSGIECESWRGDGATDKGPVSPQLPPLQRRRLSSFKDAKKYQQQNNVKAHKTLPPEDDSLDAEDIFDLEGTDSNMSRNDLNSDQDDYIDSDDDSVSHDEGIHIGIQRGGGKRISDMARSLPINMPKIPNGRPSARDLDEEEETQDIAASIKALARSVHSDVFGELPRPRRSTQI